ncbi:MAG: urate hydroxylase PuuD [Pseudomonadota bacterium]
MDAYVLDWLQLIFRWLHVITGVAWIGASFYFVWLDNHLEEPPVWKKDKGIKGDLWAIHGGGIYEVGKYQHAPEKMPETLHWFKWEAYTTWLTGMVLMILMYYIGAEAYLIDPRVAELSKWQAISIGVGALVLGWVLYEVLCASPLSSNGYAVGAGLLIFAVIFAYGFTHLFSGRGAFIHMGAVIGTIMAGNVFRVIIPSQKALVAAIDSGTAPDPAWGAKAKLRSTHNNYLTLPLLFIMISNHYPMTYAHSHNWLVLLAIIAITAFARHYFNLAHRGIKRPSILVASSVAAGVLAWVIMPRPVSTPESAQPVAVNVVEVQTILTTHCASCHAESPTDDVFQVAPGGVIIESLADMQQWAQRIKARSVDSHDMPFLNKTGMTDEERALVGAWVDAGAPGA